jgi:GUN4-like/ARM-like repeat domain, GUN4-N terminal
MPDLSSPNVTPDLAAGSAAEFMTTFLARLNSESLKNQSQILEELATSEAGLAVLMRFLQERSAPETASAGVIEGKVYQTLRSANPQTQAFLQAEFPQGIVPLASERQIDYAPLQALLAEQSFEAADRLTIEKLCELAGEQAIQRKWLYFTEVSNFPITDLQTIDALWRVHSSGKFGFSVQRELWLNAAKNWEKLWHQIGWKNGNSWTRYPQEFTWSLEAPKGHLPLSNQLRGVRVIAALLTHPAWG